MTTERQAELARRREYERREQLVEKAANAIYDNPVLTTDRRSCREDARRVLDSILPQVTSVAQLGALDPRSVVMAPRSGVTLRASEAAETGWPGSPPLTVVWQPEVTA